MQVLDTFLLDFNIGDVLLPVVVLGGMVLLLQRTQKLFGLHILTFGLLFLLLPEGMLEPKASSIFAQAAFYKFFGLALLVLAPVVYALGRR